MDVTEFMGSSDFLKSEDLKGQSVSVKIKEIHTKEFTEKDKDTGETMQKKKLALELIDKDKMVILNVTNTRACADAWGMDASAWVGKTAILTVRQTNMGPGIGVTPLTDAGELDDDIPF